MLGTWGPQTLEFRTPSNSRISRFGSWDAPNPPNLEFSIYVGSPELWDSGGSGYPPSPESWGSGVLESLGSVHPPSPKSRDSGVQGISQAPNLKVWRIPQASNPKVQGV